MSNQTHARPYAKAIFDLVQDSGDFDTWRQVLPFVEECVYSTGIELLLDDPRVTQQQLVELILDVAPKKMIGECHSSFLWVLAGHKSLGLIKAIALGFEKLYQSSHLIVEAQVTSAEKLDAKTQKAITKHLEAKMQKTIRLESTVDPSLIAGARIQVGDWVMDGTLTAALNSLRQAITNK